MGEAYIEESDMRIEKYFAIIIQLTHHYGIKKKVYHQHISDKSVWECFNYLADKIN